MPTKRTRKDRHIISEVSLGAIWVMSDEVLYPEPENTNEWELDFLPGYRNPTCCHTETCRAAWDLCKADILWDWIAKFPGKRCRYWWLYDSPRMSAAEIEAHGWTGHFYVPHLCELRLRLGGVGDPKFEHLGYVPTFDCGVPDSWLTQDEVELYSGRRRDIHGDLIPIGRSDFAGKAIDPKNRPCFESQAAYLRRHGLLEPTETRWLKPKDFQPETVNVSEDDEDQPRVVGLAEEVGSVQ
jgi:hypothetical protein